eukprot:8294315-Pyramimonas_sp.AAC.1
MIRMMPGVGERRDGRLARVHGARVHAAREGVQLLRVHGVVRHGGEGGHELVAEAVHGGVRLRAVRLERRLEEHHGRHALHAVPSHVPQRVQQAALVEEEVHVGVVVGGAVQQVLRHLHRRGVPLPALHHLRKANRLERSGGGRQEEG